MKEENETIGEMCKRIVKQMLWTLAIVFGAIALIFMFIGVKYILQLIMRG